MTLVVVVFWFKQDYNNIKQGVTNGNYQLFMCHCFKILNNLLLTGSSKLTSFKIVFIAIYLNHAKKEEGIQIF